MERVECKLRKPRAVDRRSGLVEAVTILLLSFLAVVMLLWSRRGMRRIGKSRERRTRMTVSCASGARGERSVAEVEDHPVRIGAETMEQALEIIESSFSTWTASMGEESLIAGRTRDRS